MKRIIQIDDAFQRLQQWPVNICLQQIADWLADIPTPPPDDRWRSDS